MRDFLAPRLEMCSLFIDFMCHEKVFLARTKKCTCTGATVLAFAVMPAANAHGYCMLVSQATCCVVFCGQGKPPRNTALLTPTPIMSQTPSLQEYPYATIRGDMGACGICRSRGVCLLDLGCVVMRKTSTRAPWAWLSLNHAFKPAHVNLFILFLFRPGGACRSFN